MERFVWLRLDDSVGPWTAKEPLLEAAERLEVDGVFVEATDVERVRSAFGGTVVATHAGGDGEVLEVTEAEGYAGDVTVVGIDGEGDGTVERPTSREDSGDLAVLDDVDGERASYVVIDDEAAVDLANWTADSADYLVVSRPDWEVIPLENLIADVGDRTTVVAAVDSVDAARTAFETLEIGATGVLLETDDPVVLEATLEVARRPSTEALSLSWATVEAIESAGTADRVCVDTGVMLEPDEGLLVGSHAGGLTFVHAETADGPFAAPRPFRVNAGAVHAYVRIPGDETRYLAELGGGDRVLVTNTDGETRDVVVGRAKIERRPMLRVVMVAGERRFETLLQEAETVRLHGEDGPVSVSDLSPGAEVLVLVDEVPRHFGTPVADEHLIER